LRNYGYAIALFNRKNYVSSKGTWTFKSCFEVIHKADHKPAYEDDGDQKPPQNGRKTIASAGFGFTLYGSNPRF
jgi:hypothetical protein